MTQRFNTWQEAHAYASSLAQELKRDTGIERAIEYGKEGFNVFSLPKPENRYGHELRCEVVPYFERKVQS